MSLKDVEALIIALPRAATLSVEDQPTQVKTALDRILALYRESKVYSLNDQERKQLKRRLLDAAPQAERLTQLDTSTTWQRKRDMQRFNAYASELGMTPQALQQHCIDTEG